MHQNVLIYFLKLKIRQMSNLLLIALVKKFPFTFPYNIENKKLRAPFFSFLFSFPSSFHSYQTSRLLNFYPNFPPLTFFLPHFHLTKYILKILYKWINRLFDLLCDLLKMSITDYNKVSDTCYDAKKKLCALWLGYESIHVCKYDWALEGKYI